MKLVQFQEAAADYSGSFVDKNSISWNINLHHVKPDHDDVKRLYIERDGFSVELVPSKGLSVRDVFYKGKPMFWEPPMEKIYSPSEVRLNEPMLIDGVLTPGMSWLRYFSAHIEMLGLLNWGMPTGGMGLHGNASNIPVNNLTVESGHEGVTVSGSFEIFDADGITLHNHSGKNVKPLFRVEKTVTILENRPGIYLKDRVTNLSDSETVPQWGYHVQLRPEEGAEYLIPGKIIEERFGGDVPDNHRIWTPAGVPEIREEKGFIYKKLMTSHPFPEELSSSEGVTSLLLYRDGSGIAVSFTRPAYLQSWFSCGGADGTNFMIPGGSGGEAQKLLLKNWDGVGPEFGNTALDADGNTDPENPPAVLKPGESLDIEILAEFTGRETSSEIKKGINFYCCNN